MKKVAALFLLLALLPLYFFWESRSQQFRLQDILSQIPPSHGEATSPQPSLHQKFYYLGSGMQCHAFLGEDQKTVLKFFRHNDFSFVSFLNKWGIAPDQWYGKLFVRYNPQSVFHSSQLAYEVLPEVTGVFYLHLHRTENLHGKVELVDGSWVHHVVDLDKTAFILQHYGELAISRIDHQMRQGDLEGAIGSVEALIEAAGQWRRQGIHVEHPAFRRNVGFYGDKVMLLDAGSLQHLSKPQSSVDALEEIQQVTARLRRWLYKHHPTLYPYYQRKVAEFE
jgi:hypothetical protein